MLGTLVMIVPCGHVPTTVPTRECATMPLAIVNWATLELTAVSALVLMNVLAMENVLTGRVCVIVDSWELIVH